MNVTDRPYKYILDPKKETAKRVYDVHAQKLEGYDQKTIKSCGYGLISDLWNE